MKHALIVSIAMLLVSCATNNTASTSYAPYHAAAPQAIRLGTNTLLLAVQERSDVRGYTRDSGAVPTFHLIFTQCAVSTEVADVYDAASDPQGRLYELGATPTELPPDDLCPAGLFDIWLQPLIERGDADFFIGGSRTKMDHFAHSIAIDSAGKIYVGDLHDVLIFAPFVYEVTKVEQPPIASIHTDFAEIASVRLDVSNNVYVLGTNHRIEEFAAGSSGTPKPLRTISVPNGISRSGSIAIAPNGQIYTLAFANDSVPNSTKILVYAAGVGTAPIREIAGSKTGLFSTVALAVCKDGTVYAGGGGTIRIFAPGSSGNVPATVVWRQKNGISVQSLSF